MVVTEKIILRTLGLSSFLIVLFVVSFFLDYRTAITVAVTTIAIPVAVGWYTYRKFPLPRALQILWFFSRSLWHSRLRDTSCRSWERKT